MKSAKTVDFHSENALGALWDSAASWLEAAFGATVARFLEGVAGQVIAGVVVVIIAAIFGRYFWHSLARRIRAAFISRRSEDAFVIVLCKIADDEDHTIERAIKEELSSAFAAYDQPKTAGNDPFEIVDFPLALNSRDRRSHNRAERIAKKWLRNTKGDVLIWGRQVKRSQFGKVYFVGRREEGQYTTGVIDFDKEIDRFSADLAERIALEIKRQTTAVLFRPAEVELQQIREMRSTIDNIRNHQAKALSETFRFSLLDSRRTLDIELALRSPNFNELNAIRHQLQLAGPISNPESAEDRLVSLIIDRRRLERNDDQQAVEEALARANELRLFFNECGNVEQCAIAANETLSLLRRLTAITGGTRDPKKIDSLRDQVERSQNRQHIVRFRAQEAQLKRVRKHIFELFGVLPGSKVDEGSLFELVEDCLSNFELIQFARALTSALVYETDRTDHLYYINRSINIWKWLPTIRDDWSEVESLAIQAYLADIQISAAVRERTDSPYQNALYRDALVLAESITARVRNWDERSNSDFDYYILSLACTTSLECAARLRDAKKLADAKKLRDRILERFRSRNQRRYRNFVMRCIVSLNNEAGHFRSAEAAAEALDLVNSIKNMIRTEGRSYCYFVYIKAYAAMELAVQSRDKNQGLERATLALNAVEEAVGAAELEGLRGLLRSIMGITDKIEMNFPGLTMARSSAV